MNSRSIQNGLYGWYEKEAMKKIEDSLPFRQQLSAKGIYIAICSLSARQKNTSVIECFKFDIARYASVSEKTLQRVLPLLENLLIIKVSPQDRKSDGKYEKVKIWLLQNNLTAGQFEDTSEDSSEDTGGTQMSDTINKRNKEIKNIPKGIKTDNRNVEINELLKMIQDTLNVQGFKEDKKWERIYGQHLVNLKNKMGSDSFWDVFKEIMKDDFHLKNMGKLKYIYEQVKGFVPIDKVKKIGTNSKNLNPDGSWNLDYIKQQTNKF